VGKKHETIENLTVFAFEVIRGSGEQALAYYGKGRSDTKFDEGLVTEAEIHLGEFFRDQLFARFPDHQIYRNEQREDGYSHEGKRYLWVYDAVDGVANFQAGIPIWGTSLALLENFWPVLGVFYMPVTGDIFHAEAGSKAFRGEQQIYLSPQEEINDESLLLTYSRFHERYRSSFPGKIRALGCTAAHVCYVAMGRAEAALLSNESYKDLAAAAVIMDAAGGKIFKMDGTAFFLGDYIEGRKIEEDLLAVAPDKYDEVRGFLAVTGER
jgi:myo-inositol-1(or 4)-monophosphatase